MLVYWLYWLVFCGSLANVAQETDFKLLHQISSPDYLCVFEQANKNGQDLIYQMGKLVFS